MSPPVTRVARAPRPVVDSADADADGAVPPHRSLLRPLGVVGYDAIEPALLAALASEEPLLLVSEHGAAKSLLLVRLASALGLELRHYNASLLQFDDLAGFPVPDDCGGIRYVAPLGAIWDAEVAFFDEIGRCRPETANKLFPIIHERRIQGAPLEKLRYRWAATNPPPEATTADAANDLYEGVEPLDPALADRFSFVVPLPRYADLSDVDRIAIVKGVGERLQDDGARNTRELLHATRDLLAAVAPELEDAVVTYVLAVTPLLLHSGIGIGGRRAATLRRNLLAVWAASVALGRNSGDGAFMAALLASIPDVVRRPIPRAALLAAHNAAWRQVELPETDPRRVLESVRDPVRRATLAVTLPGIPKDYRGEALCSALAAMRDYEAEIVAWVLFPRLLGSSIAPATATETVAEIVQRVTAGGHIVRGFGTAQEWVRRARELVAASDLPTEDGEYVFSVICRAFSPALTMSGHADDRSWRKPVEQCLAIWRSCAAALGTGRLRALAPAASQNEEGE